MASEYADMKRHDHATCDISNMLFDARELREDGHVKAAYTLDHAARELLRYRQILRGAYAVRLLKSRQRRKKDA